LAVSQNIYDANLCENDAMILLSVVFHDVTFSTRSKSIMSLTSCELNCHFCYFVNGFTVSK